jgi:hypothetical protein
LCLLEENSFRNDVQELKYHERGRLEMRVGFLVEENHKRRYQLDDLDVDERALKTNIIETNQENKEWLHLAQHQKRSSVFQKRRRIY